MFKVISYIDFTFLSDLFRDFTFCKKRKLVGFLHHPCFHLLHWLNSNLLAAVRLCLPWRAGSMFTLPDTNIAHKNPPFWWYLPGKIGIFMGYVSFREGISIFSGRSSKSPNKKTWSCVHYNVTIQIYSATSSRKKSNPFDTTPHEIPSHSTS